MNYILMHIYREMNPVNIHISFGILHITCYFSNKYIFDRNNFIQES